MQKPTACKEKIKQFNDTCVLRGWDPRNYPGNEYLIKKYGRK